MSLLDGEKKASQAQGWDGQRIDDLRRTIDMRKVRGISPIRQDDINRHLGAAGLKPGDDMRWRLQLVLFSAYRDAYADAQSEPERRSGEHESVAAPTPAVVAAAPVVVTPTVTTTTPDIPAEWLTCTPIQAAERMIAEAPRLLERRRGGKRAKDAVGEQTPRQIMWAATLLGSRCRRARRCGR